MPSPARIQYAIASARAEVLCANVSRSRGVFSADERRVQYGAALAAHVAAWETYLEELIRNFVLVVGNPKDPGYSTVMALLNRRIEVELKRFNTPKYENSRVLVAMGTGYDPINDWSWPNRGIGAVAMRTLVDEIVEVRHCFAHGAVMKSYSWNTDLRGNVRLTRDALASVQDVFRHLVKVTDKGLNAHLSKNFGLNKVWYRA